MSGTRSWQDQKLWYCRTCVLPCTRPNLIVNEDGSCGCVTSHQRGVPTPTQWDSSFEQLVEYVRSRGAEYDCVIPVSGGKDSTWQVVTALEYGLRPICVTWKSPARSELGEKNLANLVSLGVDHIDFTVNPDVERRFIKEAFVRLGSPAIPMHMAIHSLALKTALRYSVPLVIYGENSADEYGNVSDPARGWQLTNDWLSRYGVSQGTTVNDWIGEKLSRRDLSPYAWPSDAEIEAADVRAVFLGYFFPWDPVETSRVAIANGFEIAAEPTTGLYKFADIDDSYLISIHHFMKWPKFGFTRTWDNISIEIRHGRMTREEGIVILSELGEEIPYREIEAFCNYIAISNDEFWQVVERFRNSEVWQKNALGVWQIDNFLISDWKW